LSESPEVGQRQAERRRAQARHAEARASRYLSDFSLNTAHAFAPGLNIPSDNTEPRDQLYLNPGVVNDWAPGSLRPFNSLEVVARQPLWTWGELSGTVDAARHAVDLEAGRVDEKALEVALRTGELYYNVLLAQALDRLAARTDDVIRRAKREVQRLLNEGAEDVDDADLFEVRLTEQEFRRRRTEITQQLQTARMALRRQLFVPNNAPLRVADDALEPLDFTFHPDSLDYYFDRGMQQRPELAQAQAGRSARAAQVKVARSGYYPKLGFQASYGFRFTLPDRPRQDNAFVGDPFRGNSTRTGFGIQMNLNFKQTQARVEQAQADLNAVRNQQTAAKQLIRFEVEQAYRDVIVAETDVASRDEDVTITGEWLRTEQINFDLGFGSTENLVKAVQANLEAEGRYFEAVRRYNVAVLRLLDATGLLTNRAQSGMLLDLSSNEE
jgi:outer membrane protein TolC